MTLAVNGLDVASMRFLAPWSGVWSAELELVDGAPITPSGRVVITSAEGIALVGTVDDDRSGAFADSKRHVRVIGGGGGWGKDVKSQHFHSDVGLQLAIVASSTAALVGEIATVLLPHTLGADFVRHAGPAARIFSDLEVDWWIGFDGVTRIGRRPPSVPPTSLVVDDWQPAAGTVSFFADVLPEPGAIVVDDRFGKRVILKVEASAAGGSITGTLWLAESAPDAGHVSELTKHIAALASAGTRAELGRMYEYRVIAMAGDRVELQAVNRGAGMPDLLPASVWAGVSGYRATLTPTSRVLVGFIGGDPRRPYVAAFEPPEGDGWRPVEVEIDALGVVTIGAKAPSLALGGAGASARPVVRLTEAFSAWIKAIGTAAGVPAPPDVAIASAKVTAT